jgi:(S)-3,5-dihydroxyphenylglycine transaminase
MPLGTFRPAGFIVVSVPFTFDEEVLKYSTTEARRTADSDALFTSITATAGHQLRFSGSLLSPEQIDKGLDRLAAFVADRAGWP